MCLIVCVRVCVSGACKGKYYSKVQNGLNKIISSSVVRLIKTLWKNQTVLVEIIWFLICLYNVRLEYLGYKVASLRYKLKGYKLPLKLSKT